MALSEVMTMTESVPQLALLGGVVVASLIGSPHCVGMCGGLVMFALGANDDREKAGKKTALQYAYHGGRLGSYLILGAASGAIGAAVDFGGRFVGLQRGAAIFAGSMMIVFGLTLLARAMGFRTGRLKLPRFIKAPMERAHRFAFTLKPVPRALTIGLLTALLPCGWLYAFAFTAAGTGSPLWGAAVLGAFWIGTVPLMAAFGAGVQAITGPLHARLPLITGLLVTAVGVYTAMGRLQAPAMTREALHIEPTAGTIPTDADAACPLCGPTEEEG